MRERWPNAVPLTTPWPRPFPRPRSPPAAHSPRSTRRVTASMVVAMVACVVRVRRGLCGGGVAGEVLVVQSQPRPRPHSHSFFFFLRFISLSPHTHSAPAMVAKKRVTKVVDNRKPTHSLDAARPSKGGKGRDAATVRMDWGRERERGRGRAAARADASRKREACEEGCHALRLPLGTCAEGSGAWGTRPRWWGGHRTRLRPCGRSAAPRPSLAAAAAALLFFFSTCPPPPSLSP